MDSKRPNGGLSARCLRAALGATALLALGLAFAAGAGAAVRARTAARTERPRVSNGGQPLLLVRPARHSRAWITKHRNPTTHHAPTITTQPANVSVAAGQVAHFTTAASGNPTPATQWQRSPNRGKTWSNVQGANAPAYSFVTTATENGYWYRAMYTNSLGRAYTTAGVLTVTAGTNAAPAITAQPTSASVVKGTVVSFSATASGYPAPTIQWQVSSDGGSTWSNISGASTNPYQVTAAISDNGYLYRAVFTNGSGSAATAGATLSVSNGVISTSGAPQITTQPVGDTASSGGTATFTAAASGNPVPSVQWQVSMNGGTSWGVASGATSATYAFTASSGENGYEYRAVFTNGLGSAYTTPATLTVAEESSNWSGYAATGGVFSSVSADWVVPTISCPPSSTSFSSQWIGIDGYSSDTVEQDGTEADCSSGTPYYGAWYEMYGDANVEGGYEVPLSNTVEAGDAMSATVSLTGSTWTLAIADATQNWHYSINVANPTSPAPSQSSAEWIAERPEVCSSSCGLATLSNFGSVTFTNATATDASATNAPISAFANTPMEMVGSTVLAMPGPLTAGGTGFTDTWNASS